MTDDQVRLVNELERKFGKRIQYYAGNYFFDGHQIDLDKLERGYRAWKSARCIGQIESKPSAA